VRAARDSLRGPSEEALECAAELRRALLADSARCLCDRHAANHQNLRGQRTQGAALFASESAIRDHADLGRLSIVRTVL
jgi:hypothetical protein